jgi:arginyl-tRNA synthetase
MTVANLLERLLGLNAGAAEGIRLEYRNSSTADWDIKIVSGDASLLLRVKESMQNQRSVKRLAVKGANASILFDDEAVTRAVDRVVAMGPRPVVASEFGGQRIIVQFIDPNSTKAMHLGHLYEAILGNALAALFESLGAEVRRYCFVSDISRSVCEAMAGYEIFGDGKTPEQLGEKPDHMVGRVYAQYAARYYEQHPAEASNEDPIRRETAIVGDRADDFIRRYQAGEPAARALWRKVRDWVIAGQLETLARLRIGLDTIQYGSDTDATISRLLETGLARRVLEREPSGAVLYRSGKQEYQTVVMTRPDGFPTEHTRQMAQMISVFASCRDLDRYYTLMGMEWKPAWTLYENILRGSGDSPYHDVVQPVCHGMVMVEGSKMKSSKGAVVLADEFLDRVEALPQIQALAATAGGREFGAVLADIVVKSFFLSRRIAKDLNFSWSQVTSPADNPGWEIASAWCGLHAPRWDGRSHSIDLAVARTLLFKSFDLVRAFDFSARHLDLSVAIKFLNRLAKLINDAIRDGSDSVPRDLARAVLVHGLAWVGIGRDPVAQSRESLPRSA